jgi:thymidylate kinase
VPESVEEDQEAVLALLAIEADRVAAARAKASDLVLMDRSIHTLLAHRCALERATGLACLAPAEPIICGSQAPVWPDLVLYLDVMQQAILDRNRGKFPSGSIFIDSEFNAGIRDYFSGATGRKDAHIVWLDGMLDPAKLVTIAEVQIRDLLQGCVT